MKMKTIKITFAIMMIVGIIGISQAFACKFPGDNLSVPKRSVQTPRSSNPAPAFIGDDQRTFGKRDLVGRYSSYAQATFFDPMANRTEYATCVGLVTFDGRGHFTDKEVHSYDGTIVRDEFTGTYTINPDGTGVMHYVGTEESYDQEFVVSNDGKEITFLIILDVPGVVSQGTLKKQ